MYKHVLQILFLAFLVVEISGCVPVGSSGSDIVKSVSISPINSLFIEERKQVDKNYEVGDTLTAYVGEPIVKRRTFIAKIQSRLAAVPSMNTVLVSSDYGQYTLIQGKHYPVKYDVFINGIRYTAMEVTNRSGVVAVLFDSNGVIYDRVMKEGKLLEGNFKVRPINSYVQMRRPEETLERRTIENFEIIYGGVNNNQINMTYREYSPDDVARTAFFQELTYPTNSKSIRYKSFKIKVINISSEGITFEVVAD